MKYLVSEKLSPHRSIDNSGYLICTDAILSRTGIQDYAKAEIVNDSDDYEHMIHVNRTEEEVFDPRAMASFENKPVTIEHPDENVNPENHNDYAVGYIRDVHRGKTDDGKDVMMGTLVITDQDTIMQIQNGEYEYLSCGYDCDFVGDEKNMEQKHIRGNHVALCKNPRAGITRIQDSTDNKIFSIKLHFNDSALAISAKEIADRFLIPAKVKDSDMTIYGKSSSKLKNAKDVISKAVECKADKIKADISVNDSNYGMPIERNTVTIRRGYHNLSEAADKFGDVYRLAMKETSDINIRLLINTLEAMYIDAYNDSKEAYQKDIADTAVEKYTKAIQLANDFKLKRKQQLKQEDVASIDRYIDNIEKLNAEIEDNAIPSTFRKDILEMLDRYNENAEEQSIEFNKEGAVKKETTEETSENEDGSETEIKEEVEEPDSDEEKVEEKVERKEESKDSVNYDQYTVIADSPEEASRLVKMVRAYARRK